MIDSIIKEYREKKYLYLEFGEYINSALNRLLKTNNVHSIFYRIKTEKSLAGKLELKQKYNTLNEVTDVLGFRILTYLPKEVDEIVDVLEAEFKVDKENSVDKRLMEENEFGYMSYHLVLSLDPNNKKPLEKKAFQNLTFEVQIRTVLQHAWAEIEHDLGYKNPFEIPSYLKRRFFRLASLLELADDEFQNIVNQISEYEQEMKEKLKSDEEQIELNLVTLNQYVKSSDILNTIKIKIEKSINLNQQRYFNFPKNLIERLYYAGYKTINDIHEDLQLYQEELFRFIVNYYDNVSQHDNVKIRNSMGPEIALFYLVYYKLLISGNDEKILDFMSHFKLKSKYLSGDLKKAYEDLL